jgi:hypothetical protein
MALSLSKEKAEKLGEPAAKKFDFLVFFLRGQTWVPSVPTRPCVGGTSDSALHGRRTKEKTSSPSRRPL